MEGNADILYEILFTNYSYFKGSLDQDLEFYNNFIKYVLKVEKKFQILERLLYYIDDIEAYLFVINDNKTEILKKHDNLRKKTFILGSNLKLIKGNTPKGNQIKKKQTKNSI